MSRPYLLALLLALSPWASAERLPRLGLEPYLSPRTLVMQYAAFAQELAPVFARPLELATASNDLHFLQRASFGDFDLVLASPHLALYLQRHVDLRPLWGIQSDFHALVLVPAESQARNLEDIKGRVLNLPSEHSLIDLEMQRFLQGFAIDIKQDLTRRYHQTENNALLATAASRNEAAVSSRAVYERMPDDVKARLRILGSTRSALGLVLLGRSSMTIGQRQLVDEAMRRFMFSAAGSDYLSQSAATLRPLPENALDGYAEALPALQRALSGYRRKAS